MVGSFKRAAQALLSLTLCASLLTVPAQAGWMDQARSLWTRLREIVLPRDAAGAESAGDTSDASAVPPGAPAAEPEDTSGNGRTWEQVRAVRFPDVEEALADAAGYASLCGILQGYADGTFQPDNLLTMGQILTLLRRTGRALSEMGHAVETRGAVPSASVLVTDADTMTLVEWREDATDYQWALSAGVLLPDTGEDTLGRPADRSRFALLLYRFAGFAGLDLTCSGNLSLRADADAVPEYARVPYAWAMEHGLYRTFVEDCLWPALPVTRGQAALALTALLGQAGDALAGEIAQAAQKPFFRSASREQHTRIQEAVTAAARRYGADGLMVAVIEDGHLTDTYTYGWAVKNSAPMTADSKLRIASISKVALGMTAIRMRQDGLIDLDAPFGVYWGAEFRNPYYPNTPVTLRTILSHTSSVALVEGDAVASSVLTRFSRGTVFRNAVPGDIASWEYSNYAMDVLGLTLERTAGATMDQLLRRYFFQTLGIDGAFYGGDLAEPSKIADIYRENGSVGLSARYQSAQHAPAPGTRGNPFAGGLVISVRDLGKLAAVLANDGAFEGVRVLSKESVSLMEMLSVRPTPDGFYQGLPLRYRTDAYGRAGIYYHTGSAYGVYNGLSYDPASGDGVVVLTTGASAARDANGNYAVCGAVFDAVYRAIAN